MANSYLIEVKIFVANSNIESNCNEITFLNTGTNVANVNGVALQPNQSMIFRGHKCEVDMTNYYVNFTGAGANQLTVIRKLDNA